jgi:uncharacterized delta-60 repeat protein
MRIFMSQVTGLTGGEVRRARKLSVLPIVALLLCWPLPFQVRAAAGDLDSNFGVGGKVITDMSGGNDIASTIALQSDGKIIFGGSISGVGFALTRYTADGILDTTFGVGGTVVINLFSGVDIFVVIQPDDKVLVAGTFFTSEGDIALRRYSKDGVIDTTFGSGGTVITDVFGRNDAATGATLQSDGKIIVAGVGSLNNVGDFTVVRYNPDGSLDSSFGSGGKVITDFGGDDIPFAVKTQQDGKIVVAGVASNGGTLFDFALARYNIDGSLDQTFDSDGRVTTDFFGITEFLFDIAIQPDGKIVAAGRASPGRGSDLALARYNTNGSLDPAFGINGKVTTDFFGGIDEAITVIIQPDGKIIAAGTVQTNSVVENFPFLDFGLARYNSDGSLDQTFGSNGKINTDFFGGGDVVSGALLQPDGKIVVGGSATNTSGDLDFALARYGSGLQQAFDRCIQDESNGSIFQFDSANGNYQFTNCSGITSGGTGTVTRKGSILTLQHNAPDRRVLARVDTSVNKATATIQLFSQGATFTITDRDTANNTCACR